MNTIYKIPIFKKMLVLLSLAFTLTSLQAQQQVTVKATLDSTILMIGQQSLLHLEVSGPASMQYIFPAFPGDTLITGIEILARSPLDTIKLGKDRIELKTDYLITSFDAGLYYIPPVRVLAGTDTIDSNDMGIKIMTYDVDTAKLEIFDIKGVQRPPFVLSDYFLETGFFLLVYGLVLLLIWWYLRRKYRKGASEILAPEAMLPPHLVAIMELDRLRSEKLWKLGKNKRYYTELSEIIRKYIERRFQFNALEMTTDEILTLFKKDKTTQSVYQNLRQILQLSDLVKFAKIEPLESENELSIMNSYLFVNQTKQEEIKSLEEQKEELINESSEIEAPEAPSEQQELNKYMPK
jgi:hypothetical protein